MEKSLIFPQKNAQTFFGKTIYLVDDDTIMYKGRKTWLKSIQSYMTVRAAES